MFLWSLEPISLSFIRIQHKYWENMDSSPAKRKHSPEVSDLKAKNEQLSGISSITLDLLKEIITKGKGYKGEKHADQSSSTPSNSSPCQVFTADGIMKLARAQLQLFKSQNADPLSIVVSHFQAQSDLPAEVSEDLEMALLIQASAKKVASGEFVCARRLLSLCDHESFTDGSPVQRTVFYFARALKKRIDQELEKTPSRMEEINRKPVDVEQTLISLEPAYLAAQRELPFSLTTRCTAVQSILDSVTSNKSIHLIDFGINNGSHWTIMMQALAARSECPLELLKITAVGTSEEMMKETGNRLSTFAESKNLSFSFKIVVSDLKDLKEDFFELEADEAVVVYMAHRIWTVLAWPRQLDALLGLIKNLKPCLILVKELEVSTNLPNFMERFNESLLFFSASFDCLKVCMENQSFRKLNEVHLGEMIRNIITTHGPERIHRYQRIDIWRALFARYDIVETELSPSSLCQASLLLKRSARWSSCTISMDGKCLILSWNGNPTVSLSAWKSLHSSK